MPFFNAHSCGWISSNEADVTWFVGTRGTLLIPHCLPTILMIFLNVHMISYHYTLQNNWKISSNVIFYAFFFFSLVDTRNLFCTIISQSLLIKANRAYNQVRFLRRFSWQSYLIFKFFPEVCREAVIIEIGYEVSASLLKESCSKNLL